PPEEAGRERARCRGRKRRLLVGLCRLRDDGNPRGAECSGSSEFGEGSTRDLVSHRRALGWGEGAGEGENGRGKAGDRSASANTAACAATRQVRGRFDGAFTLTTSDEASRVGESTKADSTSVLVGLA